MNESDLIPLLDAVITAVFDNEEKFFNDLYPVKKDCQLLEFYMASERCRLSVLSWEGVTFTDTVKTRDVIDWFNGI
mgnify:CR=1 FL=1